MPKERRISAEELSISDYGCYKTFSMYGAGLKEEFSERELKKAWRYLAMKYHPDRGQASATHFILIERAYKKLKDLFY